MAELHGPGMVGRFDCAVTSREITKRDGTGRGRRLTHVVALALAGAGPMAGGADRPAADRGDPPYGCARAGLLMPVARNRIRFIEIAIRFRQNRPDIPRPRNGPFLLNRRVPGRKFVIAVACLGEIRRSQSPPSGSATAGKGMCWMPL